LRKRNIDPEALETIPGIGPSMASDLRRLGIRRVSQLARRDPQLLYDDLCRLQNERIDRCVLYAFRCAVYYATEEAHDPELLKWWNWKDRPESDAAAQPEESS
jgi:hypothetical protein